jgi:hypothetical protein
MRRLETADLLLSAGANVADNKRTLLVEAAAATQGNLEMAQLEAAACYSGMALTRKH